MSTNAEGRLFGSVALGVVAALVTLTTSGGVAHAAPRTPAAVDNPPSVPPFDPGALIGAIDDYASLLSMLTGGHGVPTSIREPTTATPGLGQPVVGQPGYGQPVLGQPVLGQPVLGQPGYGQPALGQPAGVIPGLGQPAGVMPAPANPNLTIPGLG